MQKELEIWGTFIYKWENNYFFIYQGVIIVKENVKDENFFVYDNEKTMIRSENMFNDLFKKAGINILKKSLQNDDSV